MNAFELVLLVVMGDLIQQGVTQEDTSMTGATLAVGTFAILSIGLTWATWRFRRSRDLIDGVPTVIVSKGVILEKIAGYERVPTDEISRRCASSRSVTWRTSNSGSSRPTASTRSSPAPAKARRNRRTRRPSDS